MWLGSRISITAVGFLVSRLSNDPGLSEFTPKQIGDFLKADIPNDASAVLYDGQAWGSSNIIVAFDLSFNALSQSAIQFARHFCSGILYPDYAPATNKSFYSRFAPGAYPTISADRIWGNRCASREKGMYEIAIRSFSDNLAKVQLHYYAGCNGNCPSWQRVLKSSDLTLVVSGFSQDYVHVKDKTRFHGSYWICIDRVPASIRGTGEDWATAVGTEFQISLDGQEHHRVRIEGENEFYCFGQDWRYGSHSLRARVISESGEKGEFPWSFYA
jgi:hypothetical protein